MSKIFSIFKTKKIIVFVLLSIFVCFGSLYTYKLAFAQFDPNYGDSQIPSISNSVNVGSITRDLITANGGNSGDAAIGAAVAAKEAATNPKQPVAQDVADGLQAAANGSTNPEVQQNLQAQADSAREEAQINTTSDVTAGGIHFCSGSKFNWWRIIVTGFADLVLYIPKEAAYIIALIVSYVGGTVLNWPITNASAGTGGAAAAFAEAWVTTRDLANMLIALGFVIVGIATSLRIRAYEAKQFLGKLIIVALLVNFSGLLCGVVIDGTNLATNGFIKNDTGGSGAPDYNIGTTFFKGVQGTEENQLCGFARQQPNGDWQGYVGASLMYLPIYLLVALSLLFLAIILTARYAVLGILFVLSPLAFAFWAFPFPKASGVAQKWWDSFLKWATMGIGITFFLNIANGMLKAVPSSGALSNLFGYFLAVIMVLVTGIIISIKSSGALSSALQGIAMGGLGMAMGAVGGMAKMGGKMASNTQLGRWTGEQTQKLSGKYGKAMENLGLRPMGSTAAAADNRVGKEAEGMGKAYAAAKATGDTTTMNRIQSLARDGRGPQGAAAMKVLADSGDLHSTFEKNGGIEKMAQRMDYAESSGASGIREKAEKSDPRLAGYNKQAIAKHGSSEAAVQNAYSKASVSDIRGFSTDALKDPAFMQHTAPTRVAKAAQEMSSSQVSAIQSHLGGANGLEAQHEAAVKSGDKDAIDKAYKKWSAVVSTM